MHISKKMAGVGALTATLVGHLGTGTVGAQEEPEGDPAIIAAREGFNGDGLGDLSGAIDPVLNPAEPDETQDSCGGEPGEACYHWDDGRAWLPQLNDTVIASIPNDWAASDSPGLATTTVRVYGTDWAQTASGVKAQKITAKDQMTCTGAGISGMSVGTGGLSVTGGATSTTGTRSATFSNTWLNQWHYKQDAHWRCKASNLSLAKVTRRVTATVNHKGGSTSPVAEYSFWF